MDQKTGAGARGDEEKKQLMSLLQGDGIYVNRILSRDSSVGQSSRIYYRKPEGVPFTWEMQPGTPKARPEEEPIPPLSPPPQVRSLGLPKPCVDHLTDRSDQLNSKVWFWKKIKKFQGQSFNKNDQSDDQNSCSTSSFSSSSNSSNSHAMESSSSGVGREVLEGSFCCNPWNISTILDEGNRKVYYCRIHKTAFAVENDASLVGKILPRVSSVGQSVRSYYRSSDGIPFKWEMQPGTPKDQPEDDLIPPPSPPPAIQGFGLALPNLDFPADPEPEKNRGFKLLRMLFSISNKKTPDDQKSVGNDSISRSSSISSSSSSAISVNKQNGVMKLSKFRRDFLGGYICFNPSVAH